MNHNNIFRIAIFFACLSAINACAQTSPNERFGLISISKLESLWNSKDRDQINLAAGYITGTIDGMTADENVCVPIQLGLAVIWKRVMQEMVYVKKNLVAAGIDPNMASANVLVMSAVKLVPPKSSEDYRLRKQEQVRLGKRCVGYPHHNQLKTKTSVFWHCWSQSRRCPSRCQSPFLSAR